MDKILMVVSGLVGLALALPFLALALARFNLFFTIVEEGTAKIVILNNQYHKTLMRYKGFYLDGDEVKRKEDKEKKVKEKESLLEKYWGGLSWVGLWPFFKVYTYDFRWQVLKRELGEGEKGEEGEKKGKKMVKKVEAREETLDFIFVKASTYFAMLEKAETKGMLPADSEFIFVIRITNPYRALFRGHQWFEFTINVLLPHLRQFQAKHSFEELVMVPQIKGSIKRKKEGKDGGEEKESKSIYQFLGEKEELNPDQKMEIAKKLTGEDNEEALKKALEREDVKTEIAKQELGVLGFLAKIYGITVEAVKIESVDAEKRYEEALSKKREAELEADRITTVNKAIAEYGSQAIFLRYAEAIETAGGKGNMIIPLGLESLLKELTGFTPKKTEGGGK